VSERAGRRARGHDHAAATIRPLRPHHLDEVLAIESAVYPRPWSAATFDEELARDDRCYLVVLEDDVVAGYAGLSTGAGEAHVLTVAVSPDRQRRGYGALLVATLLEEAVARGIGSVTLEVRESDTAARRLYRRAGFEMAGVRPGYYQDDGDGAVIMWWHAPDG
jgi:[ribosomal protein S18]-alanine N-acetyltransferase